MEHTLLIAGAGIGGLCTAIAARQAGLAPLVIERAPRLEAVGAGLSVFPNAMEVLDRVGVGDVVRSRAKPALQTLRLTPDGSVISSVASNRITVHRGDLQELLAAQLDDSMLRLAQECTGFTQDDGSVTVSTKAGERFHGEVLVGADGLRSRVRAQLWGERPPRPANVLAWRGIAHMSGLDDARQYIGRGIRIGMAPVDDERVYWYAALKAKPGSARDTISGKTEMLRRFHDWHPLIREVIEASAESDVVATDIFDRPPLRRWTRGRVTLIGDAAHPATPELGQGAAQAMEDAVALASCLRNVADPRAALADYEARRRAYTTKLVRRARRLSLLLQLEHPIPAAVRDAGLRWRATHPVGSGKV